MTDPTPATPARKFPLLAIIGPGVLVAATGVGAGDIATASIAGSMLGVAILWAAGFGATLKFVLTECLARWQIATQRTILEGAMLHLGWFAFIAFVIYLVPWTFVTCAALINACGVFAGAMIPYNVSGLEPNIEKIIFGIASSLVGLILVWFGGYKLFARVMTVAVGIMFACVITTAIMLKPDPVSIVSGLLPISLPQWDTGGLTRTIAYMGGVGGTLTIICYSYWMRESGRTTKAHLRIARIDALIAYTLSALFGIAVVIIASKAQGSGSGSALITSMGDVLEQSIGPTGKYI
ncbi:MAG: Nramp family divalent metal transporter, partial [Phycisphaerales bacterium]|nr:Nramp family divalent metal transporter [Phycisphaerales bacterium]